MDQQMEEAAGCAACNHMRRRCPPNCIFAPYFPVTSPSFDYVYRVYGCNNVGKILQSLPVEQRKRAAESLVFEAEARIRNPVLGCVGYIYLLQQHLAQIDRDIQEAETQISAAGYQPPALSPPLEQHYWHPMPQLTAMTAPPYHERSDDLLLVTGAATYPSIPKTEPIPLMTLPPQDDRLVMTAAEHEDFLGQIPSTPPWQDEMTDADVQYFATEIEDLLSS